MHNEVIAMDSDVIPCGLDPLGYLRMIKENGLGRFAKTISRTIIVGSTSRSAWAKAVGTNNMPEPHVIHGDICSVAPNKEAFDVVMSWSVMEHLADPESALRHMVRALRPGGVLFVSVHLYTCNSGHHDIRAFTGQEDTLPLWGHLRSSTQHLVTASAYLNRWRLPEWRALFSLATPGYEERLETYDNRERYGSLMTNALRHELREYSDEELFTVDAIYAWKKPLNTGEEPPCMVRTKNETWNVKLI
jgi:SAM-dependent methyltransferase